MRTTLNLDDELMLRAKIEAIRRRTTLSKLIEDAVRTALAERAVAEDELPSVDGGGFPEGFPFHSGTLMLDFVEGLDARS